MALYIITPFCFARLRAARHREGLTAAACVRGAVSGMVFGKSRESAVLHRRRYGRMLPDAARLEVGEKEMK